MHVFKHCALIVSFRYNRTRNVLPFVRSLHPSYHSHTILAIAYSSNPYLVIIWLLCNIVWYEVWVIFHIEECYFFQALIIWKVVWWVCWDGLKLDASCTVTTIEKMNEAGPRVLLKIILMRGLDVFACCSPSLKNTSNAFAELLESQIEGVQI